MANNQKQICLVFISGQTKNKILLNKFFLILRGLVVAYVEFSQHPKQSSTKKERVLTKKLRYRRSTGL